MAKRRKAKSDKAAAREALNKDAPGSDIPEAYRHILDVSTLDAKFAESPTIGRLMSWLQRKIAASEDSRPEERIIDCHNPRSCPDNTYHTYPQFENCIQDRGDTIADARRIWFGKLQFNNRWHMSDERAINPVPLAHAIDCGFSECPSNGMHTVGSFIGCVTSAGRPLDAAIRLWNGHVAKSEQIPLGSISTPAVSHTALPVPPVKSDSSTDPWLNPPKVDVNSTEPWPSELHPEKPDVPRHSYSQAAVQAISELKSATSKDEPNIVLLDKRAAYGRTPKTKVEIKRRNKALKKRLAESDAEKDKRIIAAWDRMSDLECEENASRETADGRLGQCLPQLVPTPGVTIPDAFSENDEFTEEMSLMTSSPYIWAYDNGLFDKVCHMYGLELVGFSSSLDSCGYGIGIGDNTHGDDSPFKWVYGRCRRIRCHVCLPHSIVEAAQQVCRVLLGHRVLGELGYFDRITKMLQHYVYSYSAEHAEDYKNPVKRKRRRKAAIRTMLKLGLSFFINITHHLRMNDGLKGGYWSPHEHFLGIGYIDVKAYQEEYKLEIAEWRRHKRLVKEGRADAEPERGPRRLAFRRRFRNQINNETERVLRNQLKCDLKAAPDKAARAAIREVFLAELKSRRVPLMKHPNPLGEVFDVTGDYVKDIKHSIDGKRVYLDNFESIYRCTSYLLSHASFEAGSKKAGHILRYVGHKRQFKLTNVLVNNADLLDVQKQLHKDLFSVLDEKKYPGAHLDKVEFYPVQTGRTRMSVLGFRDVKVGNGELKTASKFKQLMESIILAPKDLIGGKSGAGQPDMPAKQTGIDTQPSEPSTLQPAKGPPDVASQSQSWVGIRKEISATAYVQWWSIRPGTHTTKTGKVVKNPTNLVRLGVLLWDPAFESLCPVCGKPMFQLVPIDKLPDDLAYKGEADSEIRRVPGHLFERFVQSEHLYEGLPVEIANKGTRWCKGRKVPHRRLADLPPECRFEHQREREAVFVKTAVRYIVTDEIPSCDPDCKRLRRDRRIEIKPVAERYFHKYGMPKIEVGWEADACNGILHMEELEKLAAAKFADDQAAGQTQLKK